MKTTFPLWKRRLHDMYQVHGRKLFIVDIFIMIVWLGQCAAEVAVIGGKGVVRVVSWFGNVTYRIISFLGYTTVFGSKIIGRSTLSFVYVIGYSTIAMIDFLGQGVIDVLKFSSLIAQWSARRGIKGIHLLIHALGIVAYTLFYIPGRMAYGMVLRVGKITSQRVHQTSDNAVDLVTSFHPMHPPIGWQRTLTSFVVMAILLITPFTAVRTLRAMERMKEDTVARAMSGVDAFSKAQEALLNKDVGGAKGYFNESYTRFLDAEGSLGSVPSFVFDIAQYVPGMGKEAAEGRKLLEVGKEISLAGQHLTTAFDPLIHIDGVTSRSLLSLAGTARGSIEDALPHLQRASDLIETVDPSFLPEHQRELITKARHQLPMVVATTRELSNALEVLNSALGSEHKKRYLVVLQNNTEIRPTGGFIGSFALVDIDRGVITSIEIPQGGSYDLQGSLSTNVTSPDPLHLINPRWQFQDANWFPDFPTSAQKLEWFYEKSGGPSVDGVIAINAQIGADILKLTGPIPMPAYNKTITADNFLIEIQKAVEIEYDRAENKPKKLIADLVPEVIARLAVTSQKDYGTLLQTLVRSLAVNDVQVYLNNPQDQDHLLQLGLGGRIKNSPRDYAMVVDSNIAGGKTDAMIHTKAHQLMVVNDDGTIDVTMRLWREHTGVKGDLFTGVNNVDYMRMYVPKGSHLLSVKGFNPPDPSLFKNPPVGYQQDEDLAKIQGTVSYDAAGMYVNDEFDKTVFGNWVQTKPGETSMVEIQYRLPFTVNDLKTAGSEFGYVLLAQRQSASAINDYTVDVVLPSSYGMTWTLPNTVAHEHNTWHWTSNPFDHDMVIAFQFHKF